jgi:hypothetical protein
MLTMKLTANGWMVCVNSTCKCHKQYWQAAVYYHQMMASNSTAHVVALDVCQGGQNL